ncbi:helix-turn-helix transcriptional regulator [Clostridium butyricum]
MNIKEKRKERKLTQNELSKLTGIQTRVLQKIEKDNYCSLRNALIIARALGTTVEELFENV